MKIIDKDELEKKCIKMLEVMKDLNILDRKLVLDSLMNSVKVFSEEINTKALAMTNLAMNFKKAQDKDK